MSTFWVIRYSALAGARDYAAIYTWKSWLAGWMVRVVAQVVFFALIGRLLGSDEAAWFLLVGNAIAVAAQEGVWALNLVMGERRSGTLPLLAASPSSPVLVFTARGSYLILDGLFSGLGALAIAGPLFGLPLPWPRALLIVPLTLLVGASAYAFGAFLAGVALRYRQLNLVFSNVSIVALVTLCGVNVPLDVYPEPVVWLSRVLPLTHGLVAVREVLAGDLAAAGRAAVLEALVGLGWFALCLLTFNRFVRRGRRDGTLDLT